MSFDGLLGSAPLTRWRSLTVSRRLDQSRTQNSPVFVPSSFNSLAISELGLGKVLMDVSSEFMETLFGDPTMAMGAPVEDITEEFERRHRRQCKRCQEYGVRQRVTERDC